MGEVIVKDWYSCVFYKMKGVSKKTKSFRNNSQLIYIESWIKEKSLGKTILKRIFFNWQNKNLNITSKLSSSLGTFLFTPLATLANEGSTIRAEVFELLEGLDAHADDFATEGPCSHSSFWLHSCHYNIMTKLTASLNRILCIEVNFLVRRNHHSFFIPKGTMSIGMNNEMRFPRNEKLKLNL